MRRPLLQRRAQRPLRQRSFVGCEGESEQGYVALLQRLADEIGLALHLDAVVLGGGDPCAIVEQSVLRIRQRERQHGSPYAHRAILLDADRRGQVPERDARTLRLAASARLLLVWQDPCHEALLLRHLPDCTQLRPPLTPVAEQQLMQRWPDYRKPMPAVRLGERIDLDALRRVQPVEADLAAFLIAIHLLENDTTP